MVMWHSNVSERERASVTTLSSTGEGSLALPVLLKL
jgi:hypothetical protein